MTEYQEKILELKQMDNFMELYFPAVSENESLARMAVAAFLAQYNPSVEELGDMKIAVSEAVTNAIIHGYEEEGRSNDLVHILCSKRGEEFYLAVMDQGRGIADVKKAMEPLYTSKPEMERSGMGFSFMEAFTDELQVMSSFGKGTGIFMKKKMKSAVQKQDI